MAIDDRHDLQIVRAHVWDHSVSALVQILLESKLLVELGRARRSACETGGVARLAVDPAHGSHSGNAIRQSQRIQTALCTVLRVHAHPVHVDLWLRSRRCMFYIWVSDPRLAANVENKPSLIPMERPI